MPHSNPPSDSPALTLITSPSGLEAQIKEKFDLLEPLGQGSFGTVFKAFSHIHESLCAIKLISRRDDEDNIQSIRNEIDILKILDHPYIIALYGYYIHPQYAYIVLELAPEQDLEHLISTSIISEQQTKQILLDIGSALDHIHNNNIIHRDIKPANILIGFDNRIRISDFGLASTAPYGWAKGVCGTPYYQAPEMLRQDAYGQGVDWWAVGVMLYEMIIRTKPFKPSPGKTLGENILEADLEIPSHVSPECRSVIENLLERNVNFRIRSLSELMEEDFFADVLT